MNWRFLDYTFSVDSSLALLSRFKTTSVRGAWTILSNRSIDVFRTDNFSRKVQSFFSASPMFFVSSGVVSLYKYNKRSSGVNFVMSKPLMSNKLVSRCVCSGIKTGHCLAYCAGVVKSSAYRSFPRWGTGLHFPFSSGIFPWHSALKWRDWSSIYRALIFQN